MPYMVAEVCAKEASAWIWVYARRLDVAVLYAEAWFLAASLHSAGLFWLAALRGNATSSVAGLSKNNDIFDNIDFDHSHAFVSDESSQHALKKLITTKVKKWPTGKNY